jgi:hypothetical protein
MEVAGLAGLEAAALALTAAVHHGEGPGEEGPQVSVHCEEVLEEVDRFFAEVVQLPHRAVAGRKESEVDLEARRGSVHPEQRKGWEQLDAEPACWEQERVLSPVRVRSGSTAPQMIWMAAAGTAMHHAELGDRKVWVS